MQDPRMSEAHAVTFIEALLRAYLDFVEYRLPHGEGYKDNDVADVDVDGMEDYLAHSVAV